MATVAYGNCYYTAIGFDRLIEISNLKTDGLFRKPDLFIAALGDESRSLAFEWSCGFVAEGIRAEIDPGGKSLKSQMKRADRLEAGYVLIVGENELTQGSAILRNMKTREQTTVPIASLMQAVKENLRRR